MSDEDIRDIERFVAMAKRRDWLEEPVGIEMDIENAMEGDASFSTPSFSERDGRIFAEAEWHGTGTTLSDVYKDFYKAYARFAEHEQFIQCRLEPEAIVFDLILGSTSGPTHGHRVCMRFSGPKVSEVLRGYRMAKESFTKSTQ